MTKYVGRIYTYYNPRKKQINCISSMWKNICFTPSILNYKAFWFHGTYNLICIVTYVMSPYIAKYQYGMRQDHPILAISIISLLFPKLIDLEQIKKPHICIHRPKQYVNLNNQSRSSIALFFSTLEFMFFIQAFKTIYGHLSKYFLHPNI